MRATQSVIVLVALLLVVPSVPIAAPAGADGEDPAVGRAGFRAARSEWIRVQTRHFTLFSSVSRRRTVDIAVNLERYRAALSIVLHRAQLRSAVPTYIYVFRTQKEYEPFTPRYRGRVERYGGWFSGYPTANYMALDGNLGGDPLDVFYHEYIHQIFHDNLPRAPLWFEEGLAECFSTFEIDGTAALVGKHKEDRLAILRSRTHLPIRDLLAMTRRSEDFHVEDDVGLIYAQSWALVHYLFWTKPETKIRAQEFLNRLAQGDAIDAAFATSFERSYGDLQNELREYVMQRRFSYSAIEIGVLDVDTRVEVTPIDGAEVLFRLGDLLARLGPERFEEAEALLSEAIAIEPTLAGAYAAIGRMREWSDRPDEAIRLYENAVALDPEDFLPSYLLGEALLDRSGGAATVSGEPSLNADVRRAVGLFQASIRSRPSFGLAYVGYGRAILLAGEDPRGAIRLLQAARVLLPTRGDIIVNLAILYERIGDREEARRLVNEDLARLGDRKSLEEARRLIAGSEDDQESAADDGASVSDDAESAAPGPGPRASGGARDAGSVAEYDRQVDLINEAVALANGGDPDGAIALLEKRAAEITFSDLAERARALLDQMKKDRSRR